MMKQYTPSELANLTGVTPRTIRYYDQRGLLKPESRNAEGYRLYGSDALLRMQRITMLKFAGFSLGEIRDACGGAVFPAGISAASAKHCEKMNCNVCFGAV